MEASPRAAVLLAGGLEHGLRELMLTPHSRSMLRLGPQRLIDIALEALLRSYDAIAVVSDDDSLLAYVSSTYGARIVPARQSGRGGVEEAICVGWNALGQPREATILYGDIYAEDQFYVSLVNAEPPSVAVTAPLAPHERVLRVEVDPTSWSVVRVGAGDYVYAGLARFSSEHLSSICRGVKVTELLSKLVGELRAVPWFGTWVDVDTPWDYMFATRHYLETRLRGIHVEDGARVSERAVLEPPVYIDSEARVDHYAVVRGPVYIGRRALVGAHAFVRESVSVQEDAIIGAYSEVKRSILMPRAYVASHCYVADSIVGEAASISSFVVTRNMPMPSAIPVTLRLPLERAKVGAVVRAGSRVEPHKLLEPMEVY